jgi:hypothetical protein
VAESSTVEMIAVTTSRVRSRVVRIVDLLPER